MQILVTGHLGFIGAHVFTALQKEHDVIGYDWPNNLCELGSATELDAVVHLAAIGGAGRAARSPAEVMKNNVGAAIALRGALQQHNGQWPRVVHVSSFSVYGDAAVPTTEDAPIRPKEIYGASKAGAELAWVGYPGPLTTLRLSSVYGSGMKLDDPESTVIAKIAKAVRDGTEFEVFEDGMQQRDFVYVGDVVEMVEWGIELRRRDGESGAVGHSTINVCSGEGVTIRGVCQMMGAKYKISGASRPGDMRFCRGDPTKMQGILGRQPSSLKNYWREILDHAV